MIQSISTPHVNNTFLFPTHLTCLGNFLLKFNESSLFSVCVKDIHTKRVCMHNQVCAKFWNLEDGMEGMNAREILTRVPNFKNVEQELENIEKNEYNAVRSERQHVFKQTLISYTGFVQIRQSIILPLYNMNNRPVATAGIALDLTKSVDLLHLLGVYKLYYTVKTQAAQKFSLYFQLERFFQKTLSYEELRILLAMMRDTRHKQVARLLSISPKTVSSYLTSIKNKLKSQFDVYTVLNFFKSLHYYNFAEQK